MKMSELEIQTFVNSDFEENLYVIRRKNSDRCVVIDPGMEPQRAIDWIQKNQLEPEVILITHGHYDHIAGLDAFKQIWPKIQVLIGENDRSKLTDPMGNLSGHFGFPVTVSDADRSLSDGEKFTAAGIEFQTLLVPGHSAGHVVFLVPGGEAPRPSVPPALDAASAASDGRGQSPPLGGEAPRPSVPPALDAASAASVGRGQSSPLGGEAPIAFVGDTIFQGSVGRTDFPDGDAFTLIANIKKKLLSLPDDTIFYTGHGPTTTPKEERKSNPWL